eukprot:3712282-Rhodomonas_salina.3
MQTHATIPALVSAVMQCIPGLFCLCLIRKGTRGARIGSLESQPAITATTVRGRSRPTIPERGEEGRDRERSVARQRDGRQRRSGGNRERERLSESKRANASEKQGVREEGQEAE